MCNLCKFNRMKTNNDFVLLHSDTLRFFLIFFLFLFCSSLLLFNIFRQNSVLFFFRCALSSSMKARFPLQYFSWQFSTSFYWAHFCVSMCSYFIFSFFFHSYPYYSISIFIGIPSQLLSFLSFIAWKLNCVHSLWL